VACQGTQHNPTVKRKENGTPCVPGGTLALIGDLKQMKPQWLRGQSMLGYGVTLVVGVGVPIPILNEEMAQFTSVKDEALYAPVVDYSEAYPQVVPGNLGEVNYAQLRSGTITIQGREVPTSSLSSYSRALEIAETLKSWIKNKSFLLTEPVALLPDAATGTGCKPLKERPLEV
jgi:uncharacterized protein (DUF39 family)